MCGRPTKTASIETAMTACSAELGILLTVIINLEKVGRYFEE